MGKHGLGLWAVLLSVWAAGSQGDDFPVPRNSPSEDRLSPLPAAEAAAKMRLPAGFRATLFAAEPDVQNPIAMAWDPRGRLWVAENYTYSDSKQRFDLTLRDRVLIFEDRDNDGKADSRKVFTDGVQMLTSVEVGRGGVWLMCPPQLLFIPDADGDDVPDGPPQVVLDGFTVAQANYHNFANGLRWGPDGWLYGRCGHSCPGELGPPGTAAARRVPIDGGLWRYHPERKVVEVLCHGTVNPWGHDWDRHGELFFVNTVIGHLWHLLPGAHFRESFGESQNPAVYDRLDMIADHYHFDTGAKYKDLRDPGADALGGGHAHIGTMIYLGDLWPAQYRDRLFTLNQHGQRANVERLERLGAGYVGRHEPDFCFAADPFFRGLEISQAPDGNALIVDWSDTGECHEHTGVHRRSGRLFKISYGDPRPPGPVYKPWCLAGDGKLPQLWRQYQAGETTEEQLLKLLHDEDEDVRVWAIRLLTDLWPLDTLRGAHPAGDYPLNVPVLTELERLAREDESGLVQLTLASTLQRIRPELRLSIARALIRQEGYADDRDLPLLVWFGLIPTGENSPEHLVLLVNDCRWPTLLRHISRFVASRIDSHPETLDLLMSAAVKLPPERQEQVLNGLTDAFRGWRKARKPQSWEQFAVQEGVRRHPDQVRELSVLFGDGRALAEIRQLVLDDKAELKLRVTALNTLINARPAELREVCEAVLKVRVLNAAAARGLALYDDPNVAAQLAGSYGGFQPTDRPALLELLVSRPVFARALLNRLGNGQIPLADITPFHARQMLSLNDAEVTRQLSASWGELRESPAERRELIEATRAELTSAKLAAGDLSAGRQLFKKSCSQCHRLYGEGENIGPDLTGSQRSNLDYLLENLLDPSAVVGKDYRMSIVLTEDGRVLNGLIVSRDEKTVVLQTQTTRLTLNQADIAEVRETTLSPMPDGLLKNLTPGDRVNLFAYLMHPAQVSLP